MLYKDASERAGQGPCCFCTCIGLFVPLCMAAVGGAYLDDCPAQRFIPIYLLVVGVVGMLITVIRLLGNRCQDEKGSTPIPIQLVTVVLAMFCLAWFIAGNVWIYGIYNKHSIVSDDANYCDNNVYMFAFWATTGTYILLAAVIFMACIVFVFGFLSGRK